MPWRPLAERFAGLPLILAGPILRRVEPGAVTVWVALKEPRVVTLRVSIVGGDGRLTTRLTGTRRSVRLGDHLHVVAVTADSGERPITPGALYYYNLFLATAAQPDGHVSERSANLTSPGVLQSGTGGGELGLLVYPGHPLPSFALAPQDLNHLRIFHGSCRKPHGDGHDALSALDLAIAEAADDADARPHQLFLTGDQIYADDVAMPLLLVLTDAGNMLFSGNREETLPLIDKPARGLAPGKRGGYVLDLAMLTTGEPSSHLLARSEYAAMYLFTWSDALWPDELPTVDDLRALYPPPEGTQRQQLEHEADLFEGQRRRLWEFRAALPLVRRALANTPTYMICDDHDVTDDWFLDGAWCAAVLGSPLGRRIVRNALFAYAIFQAWGNDPAQFARAGGAGFLAALDAWRGDETDPLTRLVEEYLGLPISFDGVGELSHPPNALRWHYTVDGPGYRVFVLDTRTHRAYEEPHATPGLLSPWALTEQLAAPPAALNIVVSATPVLGVSIVERFQSIDQIHDDNYAYDREAWSLNRDAHQRLLRALRRMPCVVILSGDVHYGFGSVLQYWDESRTHPSTGTIVNFTSSSLHNPTDGVHKAILTIAYPRLFQLLNHGQMPPIELFAWDATTGKREALRQALAALRSRWSHVIWAVPRLFEVLDAPSTLILPAHGWPAGSFDEYPPDHRYRLYYLRDVAAGRQSGIEATQIEALTMSASEPTDAAELPDAQARLTWRQRLMLALHGTMHHEAQSETEHRRDELLDAAVKRRDLWAGQWTGGVNIIGDTNLGEVRFDWARKETSQRLWRWRSGNDGPTPETVYRASLQPPAPDDAPPLP